jgi:hypothetical protein
MWKYLLGCLDSDDHLGVMEMSLHEFGMQIDYSLREINEV